MSSKLLINVNDATPSVVPDTSAPDTGMFSVSHTDGVSFNTSMVLPIIGIAVLVIAFIAGIIVAISRRKKVNRFTTHTNKHLVAKLTTLSVVVLLGALGILNADKLTSMVNAADNSEEDTLTITTSDIEIDVDLNDTAVFAAGESKVVVDSATPYGYTLMAYVDSATTDLINETNTSSSSTINMIDSLEPTALTSNTWGFATTKPTDQTSTVFTGIPNSLDEAITLKYTEEPTTANDESTFYYGTYITPDLDYGTYSGVTITYVAIANICNPLATTIGDAVCLQDFAGPNRDQIVDSMTPERQYTLMDKRDRKTYTLAKLPQYTGRTGAPGAVEGWKYAVWMTQNLDLDIDSNVTYTNKDTDLGYNPNTQQYETATWKPSRSTYATNDTTWVDSSTTPESYDIGNKYWSGATDQNDWYGYFNSCSWDSDNMPYGCNESINPTSTYVSSTGIPQYHLGNYYNWTAAVAMNDSSNLRYYEITEQSICPAGWTIPRIGFSWNAEGADRDTFSDDSFYALWEYYGVREGEWSPYSWNGGAQSFALWDEPLFFIPSGGWRGYFGSVGLGGDYWSSALYKNNWWSSDDENGTEAGYVWFTTYVYSSSFNRDGERSVGSSVRCIARPVSSSLMWDDAVPVDF
ncbi:hypothetical protein IKT18_02830 [Candidatus Saccharibacteria bacterium]|nr:hypothetical protein [Candidatus Saccharibacteria bacterium]